MQCPKCSAENSDGRKFCGECGSSLPTLCPACGFANDANDKFCGGCGIPVAAPVTAPAPDPAPTPAASPQSPTQGERRPVTILFSDLSGYTNLSESRDPEDIHRILNRHFEIVDQIVLDHGGTIDKHIGDAVMALFGAPVAHGNDPERAVRTALAIHAAMDAMSAELGEALTVHIGIASGQVVASGMGSDADREYTVTGHSVNLAARLVDQAKAGQTFVSDEVYRGVKAIVGGQDMGEISVKGMDTPVPVWMLERLTGDATENASPIVGRQAELRQFQGALNTARQDGSGQAIYLRAEAGIGKSRLVDEFRRMAGADGFACHGGQCLDFGQSADQSAVSALVRSMAGSAQGDKDDQGRAAAAVDNGLVDPNHLVFLHDLLNLDQLADMGAIYDAMDNETRARGKRETLATLLTRCAQRSPILMVIEDLHWAETPELAQMAQLAASAHAMPVVLVITSRVENDPVDAEWRRLARPTAVATVDLQPLGADEAMALAAGFANADAQMVQDCIARAEGNPLFLEQLLRLAATNGAESLPSSVQSLVLARVDQLPAADKAALQAASVLGQHFLLPVLQSLIGKPAYVCAEPKERNLVRQGIDDFLFAHALIWESVYASLLRDRRRDLHVLASRILADEDPMLRAQHLDRADDPGAPSAYQEAAQIQLEAFRFEEALDLLGRAVELTDPGHDQFEMLCVSGDALLELTKGEDAIEMFRAALDGAETAAEKCRAWLGMVAGMRLIDAYDDALEVLDLAQAVADGDGGLGRELSAIHYFRGSIFFPMGNLDGCLEQHGKALDLAIASASPEDEAKALSGLGDAHYAKGRMKTSLEHFVRARDLCQAHGLGRIEVGTLYMIAWTGLYVSGAEKALVSGLHAIDVSVRLGHRRGEILSRLGTSSILYERDDLQGAADQAEKALVIIDALGANRFRGPALAHLARIAASRGDLKTAHAIMDEAWEVAQANNANFVGPWVLGVLAKLSDDQDKIAWALKEAEAILEAGCVGHNYYWFYTDAMDVALRAGNFTECERYADALEAYTEPEPLPQSDFCIARGRVLAALGRNPSDKDALAQAVEIRATAEAIGMVRAASALDAAIAAAG